MRKVLTALLLTAALLLPLTLPASAANSTEARIAQLEKQVATLRGEVEVLKAQAAQAVFLKKCVSTEKSTQSLKVALKLASCTISYFKKSGADKKKETKK